MPVDLADREQFQRAIEAVLFTSAEPLTLRELRNTFERALSDLDPEQREERLEGLKEDVKGLLSKWPIGGPFGFGLLQVAEGYAFRSDPDFGAVLQAVKDQKPARLSKAALETLAIIAYRQPATKPEIDHIRGVDCGGTIRMLLERSLVRIVGKKEEPGRPLLYGTSKLFLSFFNLGTLRELPSLREMQELGENARDELKSFDGMTDLDELRASAKKLNLDDEPAVAALDEAMHGLDHTEVQTREALASQGITFDEGAEEAALDADSKPQSG